jgi:predicted SAM-dependent methyltransferase
MKKLNLGSGKRKLDGYINIDLSDGQSAYPLDYIEDGSCDEIRASHILEHFSHRQTYDVLMNWIRKLKIGGVLKIAVPDLKKIATNYLKQREQDTQRYLMGGHVDDSDHHEAVFDEQSLAELFEKCGLKSIQPWNDYEDTCSLSISLNLQGTKTDPDPVKIVALMSMPRLCFTDSIFVAHKAFLPLGINIEKGTGVFWEQVLSRMLERGLEYDYIFTLDYDSYFLKEHVMRLCQLMQENPGIDAIVPLEVKRESDDPLFGRTTEQSDEGNLVPIITGHFGLTIFRSSSLRKMSRPWIWGQPNEDGQWEEKRLDPDIYFWKKFHEEGFKAYLAKDVRIIHTQIAGTFPGKDGKPIHCYLNDLNNGIYPDGFIPEVELIK